MTVGTDAAGPLREIGKYFAAVSWLSGLVVVLVPVSIVAAGAPTERPQLARFLKVLGDVDLLAFGLLTLVVALVGLALLPLQFGFTQCLEGYWGPSRLAQRAMLQRAGRHLRKHLLFQKRSQYAEHDLIEASKALDRTEALLERVESSSLHDEVVDAKLTARLIARHLAKMKYNLEIQELQRSLDWYPVDAHDIMPTRLGNILRRYERSAGQPFNLDAVEVTTLLAQVVDEPLRDSHDDARTDLDIAVRMTLAWSLTTVSSTILLWQYDYWLLLPVIFMVLVWVSYRGSVAAAQAYGEALVALITLGRFSLYDQLRLELPLTSDEERRQNRRLMSLLAGDEVTLRYRRKE